MQERKKKPACHCGRFGTSVAVPNFQAEVLRESMSTGPRIASSNVPLLATCYHINKNWLSCRQGGKEDANLDM